MSLGASPLCWPCSLGFSLPEVLTRAAGLEQLWEGWAEITHGGTSFLVGPPVLTTQWAPPCLGPSARWEGSQPLTVPGKTAEWEDLGDTQSICFLELGGSRGSGPGGKGPETSRRLTAFGEERASWPGNLGTCGP